MSEVETDDLKIIPIKPEPSAQRKNQRKLHPNLPDVYKGQLLALVAPIRSSKSTTWNNLIHNENMFKDLFSDTFIISNTIATDATSRFHMNNLNILATRCITIVSLKI